MSDYAVFFITSCHQEKKVSLGGTAPLILSIDDYFIQEEGKEHSKDPLTNKIVTKMVIYLITVLIKIFL